MIVWLRDQKRRSLDFVHHRQIFVALWHRFVPSPLVLKIFVEASHLLELRESVIHIIDSALSYLSHLFFVLSCQSDFSVHLLLSECCTNLLLLLQRFLFSLVSHEHLFDVTRVCYSLIHFLLEVMQSPRFFGNHELDIVLESFLLLVFFSVFKLFDASELTNTDEVILLEHFDIRLVETED